LILMWWWRLLPLLGIEPCCQPILSTELLQLCILC
jgi:hypothetical protein